MGIKNYFSFFTIMIYPDSNFLFLFSPYFHPLAENGDSVTGRVGRQSMRVGVETRGKDSQLGEAVNDWRSPNTAGQVSTGWR